MNMRDLFMHLASAVGGLIVLIAVFKERIPHSLQDLIERYVIKLVTMVCYCVKIAFRLVYPYVRITFEERTDERLKKSDLYIYIQNYLNEKATTSAKMLKADPLDSSQPLLLSMDDNEEVTDEFQGVKVGWKKEVSRTWSISLYPGSDERSSYRLTFHKQHRNLITGQYVKHVLDEGKAIVVSNRQRKLYTNNPSGYRHAYNATKWSHVAFQHPATFDTLAMEPNKKREIMNDLKKFKEGKEYYVEIGKAWKRGYLLYGPPGTGKSTMIAAIANFMNYDVYDLELTTVKDNSELRRLLIDTASKSVIVIEDVDCSLDLTGQRKETKKKKHSEDEEEDPVQKMADEDEMKESKVTLSGFLNFVDGIMSACGQERIIILTTNFVDRIDRALLRRGRMDKQIEMSYCCFEAFKVLARRYLRLESHPLFETIQEMLKETNVTPADVAEKLMPKSSEESPETCLSSLIEALKAAKDEEARKKLAEEGER